MPSIRKKTSNRRSTNQRARIRGKVKESRKKAKREAKKNPQLKPKKKKDPGIPSNFPFKDQILAEVAQARRQAEEEKQRRKGEKKQAATTRANDDDDVDAGMAGVSALAAPAANVPPAAMEVDDVPVLIDTTVPNLKAALDAADVVVHVLDARDPLSFRSVFVERESKSKKQVFVLNKIDLAPKEALERWAKTLRAEHPTFFFRSASSFMTSEPLSGAASQTKAKPKISTENAVGIEPLLDYLRYISNPSGPTFTITLVGVTNSGKSALLNSLLRKNAVQVYNTNPSLSSVQKRPSIRDAPSTTPHPQCLTLTYRKLALKFIDTPGLSFISSSPAPALSPPPTDASDVDEDEELRRQTRLAHDILLRNRGNISKLNNPLPAASYIFHRAALADLLILYNLPAVAEGDLEAFLASLARREGALHKRGAVVDLVGASRALVRDWKSGRLGWYTLPSSSDKKEEGVEGEGGRDERVGETLRAIYTRDEKVLAAAGVLLRKEIRQIRGIVQLSCGKVDERAVDLEATVGAESDEDEDEEVETAFEPKVKGGILKASKGKKRQPEPESDEAEDDESGEDTEEEGEGGSEDEMDVDEEMEALPVLSAKLSGKHKRDARGDKDGRLAKKVTFEPSSKKAPKAKPTVASAKKQGKIAKAGASGLDDEDKYDFTRYF